MLGVASPTVATRARVPATFGCGRTRCCIEPTTRCSGASACFPSPATLDLPADGGLTGTIGGCLILSGASAGGFAGDCGATFEGVAIRCWTAPTTEGVPGVVGLDPRAPLRGVVGRSILRGGAGRSVPFAGGVDGGAGAGGAVRYAGGAGACGALMRSLLDCALGGAGPGGGRTSCSCNGPPC